MKQDNLGGKIIPKGDYGKGKPVILGSDMFWAKDVKEFIKLIQSKVLTDWKGQNEFIDWLEKEVGDDLK